MMRFQRVSLDDLPLPNGKKPSVRTSSTFKENHNGQENGTFTSNLDGKSFRFRSPSRSQEYDHHSKERRATNGIGYSGGGDVLLQWGQRKRTRVSRLVNVDESSSSGSAHHQAMEAHKKTVQDTPRSSATTMALLPSSESNGRCVNLRKESSGILPGRNLEERSVVAASRSPSTNTVGSNRMVSRSTAGKRSPPAPDKTDRKMTCSGAAKDEKAANGSDHRHRTNSTHVQAQQEVTNTNNTAAAEKPNVEVIGWPRISIALSRKEKEDDFLAMKGTKLPQRPKKRAKNIDRALQYCFPGMWLSDLTKSRYEVREKKCVKKQKRRGRGLKGMESIDSQSD